MHLWSQSSGAQGRDRWELREAIGGRKRKKKEEGSEKNEGNGRQETRSGLSLSSK
ncbi:hypothetical protein Syun_023144 [Stephania yunnanensis]|uniref:Uncharacterized protein n=1 Tax=Stephania yunnanensis TaxID=152371 RepID=A0AAP0FFR8_9MAGN